MTAPVDKQKTENIVRRLMKGGMLKRTPKSTHDTEILLALAAASFDPRETYTESAVNEHLLEWLSDFAHPAGLDHVTVRRYLVDHCMLLRDPSGAEYVTNQTIINKVIEPEARVVQPAFILTELLEEKARRKQQHERQL